MEKTQFKSVQLSKGVMEIYDFGSIKLHAFKTNDLITDECFLVEKDKHCFHICTQNWHKICYNIRAMKLCGANP